MKVPFEVISENKIEPKNPSEESNNIDKIEHISEDPSKLLELEKQKVIQSEEKLKHVLADFQNLTRKNPNLILNMVLILKLMNLC